MAAFLLCLMRILILQTPNSTQSAGDSPASSSDKPSFEPSQTIAARRTPRNFPDIDRLEYLTLGGIIVQFDSDNVLQAIDSCYNICSDAVEPNTYDEAISGPDSEKWIVAMGEEHQALVCIYNGIWKHVAAPNDVTLRKSKWLYKIKRNEFGDIVKKKGYHRLVAKGFTQFIHPYA